MLVPAVYTTSRLFAATLVVNMLCSMLFWHKGSWGGAWHLADRAASCATLVQTLQAPVLSAVPVLGFCDLGNVVYIGANTAGTLSCT